jgi:DNA-binding transcriptional regulator YdaS (Cro superfamily)
MKLSEYFTLTKEAKIHFAKRIDVAEHTIYNILNGNPPTLQVAVAIEKATEGKVKCEDLLLENPPHKKKEILKKSKNIKPTS